MGFSGSAEASMIYRNF